MAQEAVMTREMRRGPRGMKDPCWERFVRRKNEEPMFLFLRARLV
jgi:hypothetical protein